jgi:CheY-like chemotaxis protein
LGRRLRLLLAEDNPTNRFVITRMLKDLPVTVDVAENGREAVDLALQTAYDLICMDVNMPETDGLEATRLIRQGIGMSRMSPIVAMTANVGAEDVQACRDAGMNDVVAKPVDKRSLLAAVLQAVTAPARVD